MKKGDRVRHQAGWLATVTEVTEMDTIHVKADSDDKMYFSGEYSKGVFEVVSPTDE